VQNTHNGKIVYLIAVQSQFQQIAKTPDK